MPINNERNQSLILQKPESGPAFGEAAGFEPARGGEPGWGLGALAFSFIAAIFWAAVWAAFLWGYYGPKGLLVLGLQQQALFASAMFLPPLLFVALAWTLARGAAMAHASAALVAATDRLFAADETAARAAARLGRAVRHELDALNTGLDGAFSRLRALERVLEKQIAALDEAGARAEVRGEAIAARLGQESQRIENTSGQIADAASRASETIAGRSAQLKSMIETAEGVLKMAAQSLDVQAAGFRASASAAAEAPHAAAIELDRQAGRIQEVSDSALGRAEFVFARQERHRAQMGELLESLQKDSAHFESVLDAQRAGMEKAIGALNSEAQRFETFTDDTERHLELIMANAAARASQLTANFAGEADRLKESSEGAHAILTNLLATLRDASASAQTLIAESTGQAKQDARTLVGEAMAECEKLLRTTGELSAEADEIRATLSKTVEDVERYLLRLPGVAQAEAIRVRQMVRAETEQILDLSARTLSTIQARTALSSTPSPDQAGETQDAEGLRGLARKLTQRPRRGVSSLKNETNDPKHWEMKTLLAAAAGEIPVQGLSSGNAAALGALEAALADMAIDLDAIVSDTGPGEEDWKRYLAGDRAVFARNLAKAIDETAMARILQLYRDDTRFREAADAYLSEFENLLARARQGDGGGLLTSTFLSADTGKIYLAIAYALGRL